MCRRHGWVQRGKRLVAAVPHAHRQVSTFIGALRQRADCTLRGRRRNRWRPLCRLRRTAACPDTTAGRHRGDGQPELAQGARRSPRDRGRRRGLAVSAAVQTGPEPDRDGLCQVKSLPRAQALRTMDELWSALRRISDSFSEAECTNFFRHAGYRQSA